MLDKIGRFKVSGVIMRIDMCGPACGHEQKKLWNKGPWTDEPDRVDFNYDGMSCVIHRNMMGAWCGYVRVPSFHPLYHTDCNLDVHGGITWDGTLDILGPGWWVGFDCSHAWDYVPGLHYQIGTFDTNLFKEETYKDILYALTETEKLAEIISDDMPWNDLTELLEEFDTKYWLFSFGLRSGFIINGITVPIGY